MFRRKKKSNLSGMVQQLAVIAGLTLMTPLVAQQPAQPGISSAPVPVTTTSTSSGSTIQTNYLNQTQPPSALPNGTTAPGLPSSSGPVYQGPGMNVRNIFPQNVQLGKPLESTPAPPPRSNKLKAPSKLVPPQPHTFEQPTITYPGLLTRVGPDWVSSAYLYDMPANIGVAVDVIKPQGQLNIDDQALAKVVSNVFANANINPQAEAIGDQPPLPFFHILVLAYPIDSKDVAAVSGRYFEKVTPARFDVELPGTFQAITWEKQDMIVTSSAQFNDELSRIVGEIAQTFVNDIQYYYEQAQQQKTKIKITRPGY